MSEFWKPLLKMLDKQAQYKIFGCFFSLEQYFFVNSKGVLHLQMLHVKSMPKRKKYVLILLKKYMYFFYLTIGPSGKMKVPRWSNESVPRAEWKCITQIQYLWGTHSFDPVFTFIWPRCTLIHPSKAFFLLLQNLNLIRTKNIWWKPWM